MDLPAGQRLPARGLGVRWLHLHLALAGAALLFAATSLARADAPAGLPGTAAALAALCLVGAAATWTWVRRGSRSIVLVGERPGGRLTGVRRELDEAWFDVRACPGPDARPCPVLRREPCPIGGHPVAALIVRPSGIGRPIPPCREGLGVPALLVEEGHAREPWLGDQVGWIGLGTGPWRVAEALQAMVKGERSRLAGSASS